MSMTLTTPLSMPADDSDVADDADDDDADDDDADDRPTD